MTPSRPSAAESVTIHWPEPAHLRLETEEGAPQHCEILFNDGTVERGELLRFTGRDEHLVFRPHAGHPRYPSKIVVRTSRFKRLRLTDPVTVRPIEAHLQGQDQLSFSTSQIQVYNVEFSDHEIESGETVGFVRNPIGLFLFFSQPGDRLERVFIPEAAVSYFQAGDPIGRLLVEENAVSEEQLKAAVEKQQQMRKLVLGDYLIEEGLISSQQLEQALAYQKTKPSLRLGEALIELGAVQPDALQIVLARQRANRGRPLGQILVDMGVLDPDTLNKIHAKKIGRPFVSLANFTPSAEAIRTISPSAARRLGIVPLSIEHGDLIVAAQSQLDSAALNELTLSSRMRVVPVMAQGQEIRARQNEAYGEALDDKLFADPSDVRFEGVEEIDAGPPEDDDALTSDDGVSFDTNANGAERGVHDSRVLETVGRALRAVESGGTIAIRVEANGGLRTTRIRLTRNP